MYIHMYMYMHMCVCIYIYIYIIPRLRGDRQHLADVAHDEVSLAR